MAKHGQMTAIIAAEIHERTLSALRYGTYTKKFCAKNSKIHLAIIDNLNTNTVRPDHHRCECGGYTFTTVWGGDKMVCRHCGKQYFRREYMKLPVQELTTAERENKRIFTMLLQGGDLREHREKNVLVLRDHMGVEQGELPLAFAKYMEHIYCDANVIKSVRNDDVKSHAISLHKATPALCGI